MYTVEVYYGYYVGDAQHWDSEYFYYNDSDWIEDTVMHEKALAEFDKLEFEQPLAFRGILGHWYEEASY